MTAFYNEIDTYAAQWLRNLIAAGHIAPGIVDERPIQEIESWELVGFTQCHFFAGIGIWSLALRRAGWRDDWPIWTGSCPCQPFSNAGKQKGFADDRHLWPYWRNLIAQCKPARIVGEQVASKDGREWLALVQTQMEALGIAFGASDLCAAGFSQAHIRQRNYFVGLGDTECHGAGRNARDGGRAQAPVDGAGVAINGLIGDGRSLASATGGLADDDCGRLSERQQGSSPTRYGDPTFPNGAFDWLGNTRCERHELNGSEMGEAPRNLQSSAREQWFWADDRDASPASRMDDITSTRYFGSFHKSEANSRDETRLRMSSERCEINPNSTVYHQRQTPSRWYDVDWLLCRNPSGEPGWRPVESGTFPLAHGIANRMGKLRAYGNGLDAETATAFCETIREICYPETVRPVREYDL